MPDGEVCASDTEVEEYFRKYTLAVFHVKNFVDYGEVKHDGNHIERFFEPVFTENITPNAIGKKSLRIRIVEHQVSLQDSLFQLLT